MNQIWNPNVIAFLCYAWIRHVIHTHKRSTERTVVAFVKSPFNISYAIIHYISGCYRNIILRIFCNVSVVSWFYLSCFSLYVSLEITKPYPLNGRYFSCSFNKETAATFQTIHIYSGNVKYIGSRKPANIWYKVIF